FPGIVINTPDTLDSNLHIGKGRAVILLVPPMTVYETGIVFISINIYLIGCSEPYVPVSYTADCIVIIPGVNLLQCANAPKCNVWAPGRQEKTPVCRKGNLSTNIYCSPFPDISNSITPCL